MRVHQCGACREVRQSSSVGRKGRAPAAFPPVGAYFLANFHRPVAQSSQGTASMLLACGVYSPSAVTTPYNGDDLAPMRS